MILAPCGTIPYQNRQTYPTWGPKCAQCGDVTNPCWMLGTNAGETGRSPLQKMILVLCWLLSAYKLCDLLVKHQTSNNKKTSNNIWSLVSLVKHQTSSKPYLSKFQHLSLTENHSISWGRRAPGQSRINSLAMGSHSTVPFKKNMSRDCDLKASAKWFDVIWGFQSELGLHFISLKSNYQQIGSLWCVILLQSPCCWHIWHWISELIISKNVPSFVPSLTKHTTVCLWYCPLYVENSSSKWSQNCECPTLPYC